MAIFEHVGAPGKVLSSCTIGVTEKFAAQPVNYPSQRDCGRIACHHSWIEDVSPPSQTATGVNAIQASLCLDDTVVRSGLPLAAAAAKTGQRPCCIASNLPNLLRTTASADPI